MLKMAIPNPKKTLTTLSLVCLVALFISVPVFSQNCGCSADLCCSRHGYCGAGDEYCGTGCQSGPCYSSTPSTPTPTSGGSSLSDIVSDSFFNGIIGQAAAGNCPGKSFYTRQALLDAAAGYPQFASGSADDSKREIAAFFAHATHETGYFCFIEEKNGATFCDESKPQYPCNPDKKYFGRGPLQLTWNYNYGAAGSDIKFDGLNSPETVANDVAISFKTAFWYWMTNVHSVIGQGFGATTNAINGDLECKGRNTDAVRARAKYYTDYCNQLGVSTGDDLTC